jgi:regulator of protease activity HflC (stomatin/prohibitin superfamily)
VAEVRTFSLLRHLRAEPTSHIVFFKRGHKKRSAPGLAFWFSPLGASIAEVPLEDHVAHFHVAGRSADFQDTHVNGEVTWRITDPDLIAQRVDFSVHSKTGRYNGEPLDKLSGVVVTRAQELIGDHLARHRLAELLEGGLDGVRERLERGLATDTGLTSLSIAITSIRLARLAPSAEVERALQMPTREKIQQEADDATYARRALAVEKERVIQQNELATRIELAKKEEVLIAQQGQNRKKQVLDKTAAESIEVEARAKHQLLTAQSEADATRLRESAEVDAERERVKIYEALPPQVLMGLAAKELAQKLTTIEHLTITPDMIGSLLQRVLSAKASELEAPR